MKKYPLPLILLATSLLLAAPAPAPARDKGSTEKGVYKDWKNDLIDRLEILRTFQRSAYTRLVVIPPDTSSTPMPEKDDNTYAPTLEVRGKITDILLEGIRTGLEGKMVADTSPVGPQGDAAATTLLLRGKVTEMNPGSRAARYWVGFGAGKSRVEVQCELVDAATGEVLLRLTHARASGIGAGGGEYTKFLTDDARDVGEDIGKMLQAF